jgi:cytochrome c biogenesis protein CcmG/thiol:disulfide interchange protein DsbE
LRIFKFSLPLILFLILLGFLYRGLMLDPHAVPSPLINKAAPQFALPDLRTSGKTVASHDMLGKVWLLNVWGSWCVSCREEHQMLVTLARTGLVPIVGLNWRDQQADALAWLDQFGDPYLVSAADRSGATAIDYGVYGAPETFIIDRTGMIRDKVIGPLTPDVLRNEVLPMVHRLQQ